MGISDIRHIKRSFTKNKYFIIYSALKKEIIVGKYKKCSINMQEDGNWKILFLADGMTYPSKLNVSNALFAITIDRSNTTDHIHRVESESYVFYTLGNLYYMRFFDTHIEESLYQGIN